MNEIQTAGTHSIRFYADNLPSGAYFIQLNAGHSGVETRKMLVLK